MGAKTLFQLDANKRYYLHRKIKSEGFKVNAHKRTVYVESNNEITDSISKLRDTYGYNVQTTIPHAC